MTYDREGESTIIDLSDYFISEKVDDPDRMAFTLLGAQAGASFLVRYRLGYDRQIGFREGETELEPDTLHLEHVEARNRPGLGSTATALTLFKGLELGFNIARMKLTHPRMLGVIEKLHRLGVIDERYYLPCWKEEVRPETPSANFANVATTSPAEMYTKLQIAAKIAAGYFDNHANRFERRQASKPLFAAQCVVTIAKPK